MLTDAHEYLAMLADDYGRSLSDAYVSDTDAYQPSLMITDAHCCLINDVRRCLRTLTDA